MRFNSIILTVFLATIMSLQVSSSAADAGINGMVNEPVSRSLDTEEAIGSTSLWKRNTGMGKQRHVKRCRASSQSKSQFAHKKDDKKPKPDKSKKMTKSKAKPVKPKPESSSKEQKSNKDNSDDSDDDKSSGSGPLGSVKGLLGLSFGGQCSNPHASKESPNGDINFLNCGLSKNNPNGKWSPPNVKMSQLKFISSSQAAKSGVFGGCAKYKSAFDSASKSTGVPAVLLMSFAMQESTCNPGVHGKNGEIGMMQLTPDKCKGKNCWDPTTNVRVAAQYFKSQLDGFGGNALQAIGIYNGWQKGLTYNRATSQQYGCHAQNNLDYLNQLLNGWAQGKMGYKMKVYNNLGKC
ncbi:lysozyme-like protein [Meira miltonrushii]|uniref:Lysozyme-like protein n=1 Tax=Meira miltonrushii TaxID=1280837 RepID=A0A316V7U7_9BASI|nr:lysozyme-like protein [Meira miltonrushii]PWN33596.1 lysozyme-like protein [Meira miltonrushii]